MPFTKADAYTQAASRARSGASTAEVIADADKIYNFINGTTGVSCASAAPKPTPVPRKKPAVYYMVEYRDKREGSTHLGKKWYRTYNGAYKNARSRRGTLASRFVKVVKFTEAV